MPCLSDLFDPKIGPIIQVRCAAPAGSGVAPLLQSFSALLDTGASVSCVSRQVILAAGLRAAGRQTMSSVTQTIVARVYAMDLTIPFAESNVELYDCRVLEFPEPDQSCDILLGLDIIGRGVLTLSSDGHFSFCL